MQALNPDLYDARNAFITLIYGNPEVVFEKPETFAVLRRLWTDDREQEIMVKYITKICLSHRRKLRTKKVKPARNMQKVYQKWLGA
jgi:hypothetical protein